MASLSSGQSYYTLQSLEASPSLPFLTSTSHLQKLTACLKKLSYGLHSEHCDPVLVIQKVCANIYKVTTSQLDELAAHTIVEQGDGGSPLFVPATVDPPVRRSKKKFADAEEDDGGSSPLFVSAIVEKQQKNLRSKVVDFPLSPASEEKQRIRRGSSISDDGNKERSLPMKNIVKLPSSKTNNGSFETILAKGIARKVTVMTQDHGTKSAIALEVGQDKCLSKSAPKAAPVVLLAPSSSSQVPTKQHTIVPKKLLLRSYDDDNSSESDDGLEAFLKQMKAYLLLACIYSSA